jgi:hypothetical protein
MAVWGINRSIPAIVVRNGGEPSGPRDLVKRSRREY